MNWSSKQRLNREDRHSLAKDLLAFSMKLENERLTTSDIINRLNNMTLDITMKNTTERILINRGKD